MSLESGRKFGLIASLMSVILPIVAVIGTVTLIISTIVSAASGHSFHVLFWVFRRIYYILNRYGSHRCHWVRLVYGSDVPLVTLLQ